MDCRHNRDFRTTGILTGEAHRTLVSFTFWYHKRLPQGGVGGQDVRPEFVDLQAVHRGVQLRHLRSEEDLFEIRRRSRWAVGLCYVADRLHTNCVPVRVRLVSVIKVERVGRFFRCLEIEFAGGEHPHVATQSA